MNTKCAGLNCPSTDGQNHSPECRAEHAAAVAGGRFVKGDAEARQAYVFLAPGDVIEATDERYSAEYHKWKPIAPLYVGSTVDASTRPVRRALSAAEPHWRDVCAALIDIYDDGMNNAPEDRCYVDGAWKQELDNARALLRASDSATASDKEGL